MTANKGVCSFVTFGVVLARLCVTCHGGKVKVGLDGDWFGPFAGCSCVVPFDCLLQ